MKFLDTTAQVFLRFPKKVVVALVVAFFPLVALADDNPFDPTIGQAFGLGNNTEIRGPVLRVLAFILGFLGLAAVLIVLYGGFLWMTARGNEDQVEKAKDTLRAGLIGVIIILTAFALTQFVITRIAKQIG